MASTTFASELAELLHVSHVVGTNTQLVQAGGGNTSVKNADGTIMLIKASGTPLGAMTPDRGWVAVDLDGVKQLLEKKELRSLPNADRERLVLELLHGCVIEPLDARPSVETPLHALLDRVVMHSHAVVINALACHPQGEKLMQKILGDRALPPLWVPYTDPGSTLAFALADSIADYRREHGLAPDVLVLENHGLFVAASTPTECVLKQTEILFAVEIYFSDQNEAGIAPVVQEQIRNAVQSFTGKSGDLAVRFSVNPLLTRAARSELHNVFSGSLTPDHIVYTGPSAVILEAGFADNTLAGALRDFETAYGQFPRLLLVKGQGMCIISTSESKLDAAELLAVSAVQIADLAQNRIKFLSPQGVDFILNWEAEHYRAKQNG